MSRRDKTNKAHADDVNDPGMHACTHTDETDGEFSGPPSLPLVRTTSHHHARHCPAPGLTSPERTPRRPAQQKKVQKKTPQGQTAGRYNFHPGLIEY